MLEARKVAKRAMAVATTPFAKAIQNGRQLALKVSANSVYGFTGATIGQLPCLAISSSVTSFGRQMVESTKKQVEGYYNIANGYSHNAEVVYGDTDSVMIKFGVKSVSESMALGVEAATMVTNTFKTPIKLEFEKVYFPYLLINKKRYAGLYWTNATKWDKLDCKGIETVRRDNCLMVTNVISTCLDKILIERSIDGAIAFAKGVITDLLLNRLDLSWLIISKSLSGNASEYTNKQPHVELAKLMHKRDPSTAPVSGDRVAYVIISKGKGARAWEKAEDPLFVLEHDIPIDVNYYLQNQLKGPLTRIFEPILGNNVNQLFNGEHTRSVKILTPSTSTMGITRFTVKTRKCLGCKIPLSGKQTVVCGVCENIKASLYIKQLDSVRQFEQGFSQLWVQCQRCQGSLHQVQLTILNFKTYDWY